MSIIAAFASFSSLAFLSLGFVGNGVITVMINSRDGADDDADNQSGDNRGSAHTSISLPAIPYASLNFAIRLSALCSNPSHNQRPAVGPDIAATVDCLTDITTINHTVSATLLNLLQYPQRPDFSERSLSGQAACGRHPTNGKEAGSVRRLLI